MAIVSSILQGLDGTIEPKSGGQGGTLFRIFLSVANTKAQSSKPVIRSKSARCERLLRLDSDTQVRDLAKRILNGLGYEIDAFSTCKATLADFQDAPEGHGRMVVNLSTGSLSGLEFAAHFR